MEAGITRHAAEVQSQKRHKSITCGHFVVGTADMRLASLGVRARRAAEASEPEAEEATEPGHHENSHTEHHEHPHSEHHPGHDYNHMKEKFMNELHHLPSEKEFP